jgi:colicin import membrane protein
MNEITLIPQREVVAADVFKPGGIDAMLNEIAARAKAYRPDVSTATGRKEIASIAYKVAQSKTLLDGMGKDLVAGWKRQASLVDEERRKARDFLDALKEEVRAPLTAYEQAEEARLAEHEAAIAAIRENPDFYTTPQPSADFARRLEYLRAYPQRNWQEFERRALDAIAAEIALAERAHAAAVAREAEQAELARLRAEAEEAARQKAEQERAERDERIAAEAAEAARKEAEARAAAEMERVEQEKAAAEARAQEADARAERQRIEGEQRAERERAAAVETERRRVAAEKAAEDAENARRAADRAHKGRINSAILAALMERGFGDEQSRALIAAMAKGEIPHVRIAY